MDKEDITLPKATIAKIVKEVLPDDIKCSSDARDIILNCCIEFIHLLSSEANEYCEKENKKTISAEHIVKSLQSLGFETYIKDVKQAQDKLKIDLAEKPKMQKKLEKSGLSEEELLKMQQELFAKSRSAVTKANQEANNNATSDPIKSDNNTNTSNTTTNSVAASVKEETKPSGDSTNTKSETHESTANQVTAPQESKS
jgi:histone H3/H4